MTALREPEAVVLDFGDTILHEGPVDVRAGVAAVLALNGPPDEGMVREVARALRELVADLNPRRQASQIELPPETVWRLVYEPFGLSFNVGPEELEWAFWSAATTWETEPGVAAILQTLAEKSIPVGVLSNTMFRERTIRRQLATSGIEAEFAFVMTSADYVLRKPHRRLFELAARRCRVDPGDIWFIGDSIENDVHGAADAGLVPIWYAPRGQGAPCERAAHVISSWSELAPVVAGIRGKRA